MSNAVEKVTDQKGLETLLTGVWSNLFGRQVDIDADFFDLGGDSFKLIQMTADLEREGYKVLMNDVYKYSTIRSLARYMSDELKLDQGITSAEDVEKKVQEVTGAACNLRVVDGANLINILFIDENVDGGFDGVRTKLRTLGIPSKLLPHYILPLSKAQGLSDTLDVKQLTELGVLSDSEQPVIAEFKSRIDSERAVFDKALLGQPVTQNYPLSNIQKIHFRGEVRLQLYFIEFNEMVDAELLEQAFVDVVGSHGLLRSCLHKHLLEFRWEEHAAPDKLPIPRFDLSGLTKEAQERVLATLAREEWAADFKVSGKPMYHIMLIKLNEQNYHLFFQFDHSIFDVSSGQVIRRDILSRYKDLKKGEAKPMPVATSYQEYLNQVQRGPVGIDADGIIEKFDLVQYGQYIRIVNEKLKSMPSGRIQEIRFDVDLTPFKFKDEDTNGPFEVALQVYILMIARLLKLDKVPFDLLFQNRRYEGKFFSDVVGLVLDGVPFLIPVDRENPSKMTSVLRERVELMNKHNINFLNMIWNVPTWFKWRKVIGQIQGAYDSFYCPFLLNYAGNAETEYAKIWDYSMAQLDDEDQKKLNYADFYGLVKGQKNRLEFLVLCKFEPNMDRIRKIFDEEMAHLLKAHTENQ